MKRFALCLALIVMISASLCVQVSAVFCVQVSAVCCRYCYSTAWLKGPYCLHESAVRAGLFLTPDTFHVLRVSEYRRIRPYCYTFYVCDYCGEISLDIPHFCAYHDCSYLTPDYDLGCRMLQSIPKPARTAPD